MIRNSSELQLSPDAEAMAIGGLSRMPRWPLHVDVGLRVCPFRAASFTKLNLKAQAELSMKLLGITDIPCASSTCTTKAEVSSS